MEGPLYGEASGRDERFGRALLRNDVGEVYSLDLYETRDVQVRNLRDRGPRILFASEKPLRGGTAGRPR
jgi:hypothetical protein